MDPVDPLETLAWEKVLFRLSKTMISRQQKSSRTLRVSHFCMLLARKVCFYSSQTILFPTAAVPLDPPDLPDPPDPVDPSNMVPELALRPPLPHAPEVRMT